MEWLSKNVWQVAALLVAVVSLCVAYWRARTARLDNLQTRFQKGAEMFGGTDTATFLGGLYELQQLAKRYPKEYHVVVMKVLTGYVREKMRASDVAEGDGLPDIRDPLRERAEEVLRVIGGRSGRGIKEERDSGYRLTSRKWTRGGCSFRTVTSRTSTVVGPSSRRRTWSVLCFGPHSSGVRSSTGLGSGRRICRRLIWSLRTWRVPI